MGSCAGKKAINASTQPAIHTAEINSRAKSSSQELADLRKFYEEEGGLMNRKVKACYEVVLTGDAAQTVDINMKFINLGESGAMHLSKVLPCFHNLRSLRLWKTKLGVEGAKLLSGVFPRLHQLQILSLEDNEIKAEGTSYIARTLLSLPLLSELYLHVNKMGHEGVTALSSAFSSKDNLKILTMDENQIGKQGLMVLLMSLARSYANLTLLGLAFNQLGDEGARELVAVLRKMPELKKLTLSGNNITPKVEQELMTAAASTVDFLF